MLYRILAIVARNPNHVNTLVLKMFICIGRLSYTKILNLLSCESSPSHALITPEIKISCVITFADSRRVRFLKQAIRSVTLQQYENVEIIIVDSSLQHDLVVKELSDIDDPRVFLKSYKSSSPGNARNFGSKFATGEVLVFLDDDNFFLPTYFQQLAEFYSCNPNVDVGLSHFIIFRDDRVYDVPLYRKYTKKLLSKRNPSDTNVMSFNIQNGFMPVWPEHGSAEDWSLLIQCELNQLLIKQTKILSLFYRIHNLNRSNPRRFSPFK